MNTKKLLYTYLPYINIYYFDHNEYKLDLFFIGLFLTNDEKCFVQQQAIRTWRGEELVQLVKKGKTECKTKKPVSVG